MNKLSFPIGSKTIGDGSVLLQSMGDRKTTEVDFLIEETNLLARMGMDMMRFSVLDEDDVLALKKIKEHVAIPVIADIHFNAHYAIEAMENGIDKIRINPGNIGGPARLREVISVAKRLSVPIRIGVNSGSLMAYKGKGKDELEDYFLAMDDTLSLFREMSFDHLVLSLKSSSPERTRKLYEIASKRYPYPLHIGLTESGFGVMGATNSAVALFPLLKEGIGDTLRVSLSDERKEELRVCKTLLRLSGRRKDLPTLVVCPTCGRTLVDIKDLAREVCDLLDFVFKDIKVAVMGCPVNGVGEAKDADIGIAGSGKKDVYLLFSHGKSLGLHDKKEAFDLLKKYIEDFRR